jgi:hypothetical protein
MTSFDEEEVDDFPADENFDAWLAELETAGGQETAAVVEDDYFTTDLAGDHDEIENLLQQYDQGKSMTSSIPLMKCQYYRRIKYYP